ncbi:MAG TPA: hypothetical protein VMV08_09250 [Gaiellaceae bacterium]|nr:hypothetical protein [Gaiellaceae bacterium]
MPRLLLPAVAALALVLVAQATPAAHFNPAASGVPTDLRAFLLRADEPVAHTCPRTPSFAWHPTSQTGGHYQRQSRVHGLDRRLSRLGTAHDRRPDAAPR